ncbi:MAG: hypothetical protein ACJAVV_001194 [Alphaproteobacteria bacterium]|jgi:hypothetical protein
MRVSGVSMRYGLATLCIVLITVLIDWLYFADETLYVIDDSPTRTAQPEQVTVLVTKKLDNLKNEVLTPQKDDLPKISHLAFAYITLPVPPAAQKAESLTNQLEVTDLHNTEPHSIIKPATTFINNDSIVMAPVLPARALSTMQVYSRATSQTKSLAQPSKVEIKQRLSQLVALKGSERSLYFPEATTKQILEYMHSCIGIDVGAVQDNKLTVFSHKNKHHSAIVRVASGYRTQQEQALLDVYAPNQTLVRLYPISFDEVLGKSIARYLGTAPLTQLSGQYALRRNSLWLTNVSVNQKNVLTDWQLSRGC